MEQQIREKADRYVKIMSEIVGTDILAKSRKQDVVWARNIVAYQLFLDGFMVEPIGKALGLHHSTISYCFKQVVNMLKMPLMYSKEIELWHNFKEILSYEKDLD